MFAISALFLNARCLRAIVHDRVPNYIVNLEIQHARSNNKPLLVLLPTGVVFRCAEISTKVCVDGLHAFQFANDVNEL